MLVHFRTLLKKPVDMSPQEFYAVWLQEAEASLAALEAGVFRGIWKVPGRHEVIGVIEVDDADALDRGIEALPLWKAGLQHAVESVEWTLLRPYEAWAEDLKGLAAGGA